MKYVHCLFLACSLFLVGCGGGGASSPISGSSSSSPSPTPVNGVFAGTYSSSAFSGTPKVYGVVESGRYAYFADTQGGVYVLPNVPETGSFSGTLTAYASPGTVFANGSTVAQFSVNGNATASSLTGSFSGAGETGSFTLNAQSNQVPTLASLAGSYNGVYFGSNASSINVNIGSDGSVNGSDSFGCSITGTASIDSFGLLRVTANSSCSGAFTGLGFASSSDLSGEFSNTSGTYVYVGASNAQAGFAMELRHQ